MPEIGEEFDHFARVESPDESWDPDCKRQTNYAMLVGILFFFYYRMWRPTKLGEDPFGCVAEVTVFFALLERADIKSEERSKKRYRQLGYKLAASDTSEWLSNVQRE